MIVRPNRPLLSQHRPSRRPCRAAMVAASVASALFGLTVSFDTHAQASAPAASGTTHYTVKPGQSLTDIAGELTGSTDKTVRQNMARTIFDANPNAFSRHDPSKMRLGSVLIVPSAALAATPAAGPVPVPQAAPSASEPATVAPVAASSAAAVPVSAPADVASATPAASSSLAVTEPAAASGTVGATATGSVAAGPSVASGAASTPETAGASGTAAVAGSSGAAAASEAPAVVPASVPVSASTAPASAAVAPAAGNPDVWSERAPIILLITALVFVGLLIYALVTAQRRRRGRLEDDMSASEIDHHEEAAVWAAVSAGGPLVKQAPDATTTATTGNHVHNYSHDVAPTGAADLDAAAVQRGQSELNGVAASFENYDAAQTFETPADDTSLPVLPPPSHVAGVSNTFAGPVEDIVAFSSVDSVREHSHEAAPVSVDFGPDAVQHGQSELNAVVAAIDNHDAAQAVETPDDDIVSATPAQSAEIPPADYVADKPVKPREEAATFPAVAPIPEPIAPLDPTTAQQSQTATRRAPFVPDAPASLHRSFIPPRPAEVAAALAAERAAAEAREQAEREAREAEARALAERQAREEELRIAAQREAEAREQAEREAREEEARIVAQREAEAREQAEREAREEEARVVARREAEAREQAEREAREEEARLVAQREAEAREQAEREAREQEARLVAQREAEAREQAEREAREQEARLVAQREAEAREQAEREAREQEARLVAQREAEAREQAEREAREEEARLAAQRESEAREQVEREAREEEARRSAQHEAEARERAQREAYDAEAQFLSRREDNGSFTSHDSNDHQRFEPHNAQPNFVEPEPFPPYDQPARHTSPDQGYSQNYDAPGNVLPVHESHDQPSYHPYDNPPEHVEPAHTPHNDFAPHHDNNHVNGPQLFESEQPFVANPASDFNHQSAAPQHYDTQYHEPEESSPYDDEPSRDTPFPQPTFPADAIEALDTPEFDLPPRQPHPVDHNVPAASVEGMGASRFGPLSLDFDYNQPASLTDPLPAFTPEQIATIAHNKLDLASEYIGLGDLAGARTLLQEVIESNDPATRQRAATLLSTLAPLS